MDDIAIARALHVLAVVHWIGGVAMVTAVILPAVRRLAAPERRLELFETVERRFSAQVKISLVLAVLTGLHMTHRLGVWDRFLDADYWWMHAMVLIWLVFGAIVFVAEPLCLHDWFLRRAARDPDGTFALVQRAHWVLLTLSVITVGAAVLGAHGML